MKTVNFREYLECTDIINFDDPAVKKKAKELIKHVKNSADKAVKIYEFVRDKIDHTFDIKGSNITCRASDVLKYRQGICYAKANLLAALLRFAGIPAGFGYQSLILDDDNKNYIVLHGYNFVYLEEHNKWIKLDARGNKIGVNAQFSVEKEFPAFFIRPEKGESDENINHCSPKECVIRSLKVSRNLEELIENLPRNF